MFDGRPAQRYRPAIAEIAMKFANLTRNTDCPSGVYTPMKRDSSGLLALTLRTGLMVLVAMILILILLPAVLAAQAAGLR